MRPLDLKKSRAAQTLFMRPQLIAHLDLLRSLQSPSYKCDEEDAEKMAEALVKKSYSLRTEGRASSMLWVRTSLLAKRHPKRFCMREMDTGTSSGQSGIKMARSLVSH